MGLVAIAGGTPPAAEGALACCFEFVALPLVVVLAGVAVARGSVRAAAWAAAIACLPLAVLICAVAGYEPSADSEVRDDQAVGRSTVLRYAVLAAVAGVAAAVALARRRRQSERRASARAAEVTRELADMQAAIQRGAERLEELRGRAEGGSVWVGPGRDA